LLTLSLLNLLKNSSNARIINVSSSAHITGKIHFENINLGNNAYTPLKAYCQSKLANILFTRELAKRLGKNTNIKVYCLQPGFIRSDLWRHSNNISFFNFISRIFFIDVEKGAQTTLFCVLEESLDNETGFYYE
jgi:NAD(P)-dependent dehydrogenase (short-subunit alcohol dehydrogenase family)